MGTIQNYFAGRPDVDVTKPYAEVEALVDNIVVFGIPRPRGEVFCVNYDSLAWESSINIHGESFLEDETRFRLKRVDPPKNTEKAADLAVVEEKEPSEVDVQVMEEESPSVAGVSFEEEKKPAAKKTTTRRKSTSKRTN